MVLVAGSTTSGRERRHHLSHIDTRRDPAHSAGSRWSQQRAFSGLPHPQATLGYAAPEQLSGSSFGQRLGGSPAPNPPKLARRDYVSRVALARREEALRLLNERSLNNHDEAYNLVIRSHKKSPEEKAKEKQEKEDKKKAEKAAKEHKKEQKAEAKAKKKEDKERKQVVHNLQLEQKSQDKATKKAEKKLTKITKGNEKAIPKEKSKEVKKEHKIESKIAKDEAQLKKAGNNKNSKSYKKAEKNLDKDHSKLTKAKAGDKAALDKIQGKKEKSLTKNEQSLKKALDKAHNSQFKKDGTAKDHPTALQRFKEVMSWLGPELLNLIPGGQAAAEAITAAHVAVEGGIQAAKVALKAAAKAGAKKAAKAGAKGAKEAAENGFGDGSAADAKKETKEQKDKAQAHADSDLGEYQRMAQAANGGKPVAQPAAKKKGKRELDEWEKRVIRRWLLDEMEIAQTWA